MNPDLCVEVHRYEKPENVYRFYYLFPHEVSTEYLNKRPFAVSREEKGPNYCEMERHQVRTDAANDQRCMLAGSGYKPYTLEELSESFRRWVVHNQCPIEFHRVLDAMDPEWTPFVTVWVRGDLPA